MNKPHSFHIPVMGIGYTLETPLKVSQFGIDSVVSLVDDILLEKLRKMYCEKFQIQYDEITNKMEDFRAKRITSYLNLINELTHKRFKEFKNMAAGMRNELKMYLSMLPDTSSIRKEFVEFTSKNVGLEDVVTWFRNNLPMGSIDVNIMTKVDKTNYVDGEKLPSEYNDAHAALRGFANSDLQSSVILSAGMNPRLYGYFDQFDDFFPNEHGELKKKIILKVSDYRSAVIQGKYLAKKGLWVSEYRIESGLNCGGHAFATDGYLLGPVLAEFRDKRQELINSVHDIYKQALSNKNKFTPDTALPLKISAQGGVGTAEEHQFLLDEYEVDSVGWGTPFLLVPEATTVDDATLEKLTKAKEDDLYLSGISPLGVPFNTLKGNTKDDEKQNFIDRGRPGSSCPKKYVSLNMEFNEEGLCIASRKYQKLKLEELELANLPQDQYKKEYDKIIEKSCICVGLGTSVLLANDLDTRIEGKGVSICPGPNLAYFSKIMSLKEITDHIYGRANVVTRTDRPNMFIKELDIYLNHLKTIIAEIELPTTRKQNKFLSSFVHNLNNGIEYYVDLFNRTKEKFNTEFPIILNDLQNAKKLLERLKSKVEEKTLAAI